MLSIAACRELLGEYAPETDREVEELRDLFRGLAVVVLDSEAERARKVSQTQGERPVQEPSCAR